MESYSTIKKEWTHHPCDNYFLDYLFQAPKQLYGMLLYALLFEMWEIGAEDINSPKVSRASER